MRTLLLLLLMSLPCLAQIEWKYDLGVHLLEVDKRELLPEDECEITFVIRNHGTRNSTGYRVELMMDELKVGEVVGRSLRPSEQREHRVRWRADRQPQTCVARLTLIEKPLGAANDEICLDCRDHSVSRLGSCFWPESCTKGTRGEPCACHPRIDNPLNNEATLALVPKPEPELLPGVDLSTLTSFEWGTEQNTGRVLLRIEINNRGDGRWPHRFDVAVTVGGRRLVRPVVGGIESDGQRVLEVVVDVSSLKETPVVIEVDAGGRVKEADENNNREEIVIPEKTFEELVP